MSTHAPQIAGRFNPQMYYMNAFCGPRVCRKHYAHMLWKCLGTSNL